MNPVLKGLIGLILLAVFVVEPLWDVGHPGTNVLRSVWTWFIDFVSLHAVRWAAVAILVLYACYRAISGRWNPLRLALGEDNRLSTSKFQFLLWTVPVLFVFIALALGRKDAALASLPQNVLIALGLSLTTMVGAKGITVSYAASNRVNKTELLNEDLSLRYLIQDDSGRPDLTKAQMLAWTAIAIGAFLFGFLTHYHDFLSCTGGLTDGHKCFPDIDTAMMVLMGLGQGTYLGGKFVAADPPEVDSITATATDAAVTILLKGMNLSGGSLTVNGITPPSISWAGTTATATLANPLGGVKLVAGNTIIVAGRINNVGIAPATIQIT